MGLVGTSSSSPHAGLVPLGALGSVEFTLATLPLTSNQYIELDINVSVLRGPAHCWGVVGYWRRPHWRCWV